MRRGEGARAAAFLVSLSGGGCGGAFLLSAHDDPAEIGFMEPGSDFPCFPVIRFGIIDEASRGRTLFEAMVDFVFNPSIDPTFATALPRSFAGAPTAVLVLDMTTDPAGGMGTTDRRFCILPSRVWPVSN